ncbi:hypothetical protein PsorP6_012907 [Peronosclerospora sorghi]|uniref:Uncharacterized protein n=1 Tax=Peronosclerospora sorghi TaxID=230839 RepID=A0ACC0WEL7_9STRA|nr:hypothetical protein PsorP6_012907 [Peronosclerospora sorghi]
MTSQGFSQTLQHKYELAWKSMQWEAVLPCLSTPCTEEAWRNKTSGENGLVLHKQRTIFESLRAIAHEEYSRFHDVVAHEKTQLLRAIQLNLHSFESSRDLHSALIHFQAIREIEELATQIENDQRGRTTSRVEDDKSVEAREAHPLFTKWKDRIAQVENEFDKAESLLSLEEVLFLISKTSDLTQVLINLDLDLASLSRKAGRTAVAYRSLLKLEQLDHRGLVSVHDRTEWQLHQGKFLWQQQECRSAIWTGKKVCSELSTYVHASSLPRDKLIPLQLLMVKGLTLTGKWIASQRS